MNRELFTMLYSIEAGYLLIEKNMKIILCIMVPILKYMYETFPCASTNYTIDTKKKP